jgi:predicted nucleotidyltransferase
MHGLAKNPFNRKIASMKPSSALSSNRAEIRALVIEHGMLNPRVFGSVSRHEDTDDSDLDILVDPQPSTSLLDIAKLQLCLEKQLGVHVDVLTPKALPESFRDQVINNAIPV